MNKKNNFNSDGVFNVVGALPEETVRLLHEYFDAFANLYNIIPLRKALEIYNRQNPKIIESDYAAFVEIVRHERQFYAILGQDELYIDGDAPKDALDRELIQESVWDDVDEYESLKAGQANKPYYIPGKAALLKYSDDLFFERTPEFDELSRYIHSIMKCSKDRTEELAGELQMHATFGDANVLMRALNTIVET